MVYKSAMTNFNTTPNYIFCASERELLTLSLAEIIEGLQADYKSFSGKTDAGIRIPESKQEPRMSHSCILYAEGIRLAHTHLDLGKRLVLSSLFDNIERVAQWYAAMGEKPKLKPLLKKISEFDQLELNEKIILANIFGHNTRAVLWLATHGEVKQVEAFLKNIEDYEKHKAELRENEKAVAMKFKGVGK